MKYLIHGYFQQDKQKSQNIMTITPPLIWLRVVPFKRNFGRLCKSNSILSSMSLIVENMYPTPGKMSCLAHGHSKSNTIQMVELKNSKLAFVHKAINKRRA
jgi:hypothetical protein